MQINLVTNVGNASNLHVLLDSDIQDFVHITLRYRSKISSAETSNCVLMDAARRKNRREKKL